MYSHINVATKAIAPNHSIYFGAPCSSACSIISKSKTKFRAAIATTNKLIPIPIQPVSEKIEKELPVKILKMKLLK